MIARTASIVTRTLMLSHAYLVGKNTINRVTGNGRLKMKILSNKAWEAILDIARENDRKINELEAENKRLKRDLKDLQDFCISFANDNTKFGNAYNLDFPNSDHKTYNGYVDKFI